jgi:hypothetical protein
MLRKGGQHDTVQSKLFFMELVVGSWLVVGGWWLVAVVKY